MLQKLFSLLASFASLCGTLRLFASFLIVCFFLDLVVVAHLEHSRTDWNLPTHDDALCDALDLVLLALDGRVVQMVCGHFETCQHQD